MTTSANASLFVRRLKRISHSCTKLILTNTNTFEYAKQNIPHDGFFVNQYSKKRARALLSANDDKYGVDDD